MFLIAIFLNIGIGISLSLEKKRDNTEPSKLEWFSIIGVLLFFVYSLKHLVNSQSGRAIGFMFIFFLFYIITNFFIIVLLKVRKKPALKVYQITTLLSFLILIVLLFLGNI